MNTERKNATNKRWASGNRDEVNRKNREWYAKNKEARRAYNRAYREKNRKRIDALAKAYREENREQIRAVQKLYRAKSKRKLKHANLSYNYGISIEDYEHMLKKQGGLCAICLDPPGRPLHVDHSHSSGAVRGLLCGRCNPGIAMFREDPRYLAAAIQYLNKWRKYGR